MSEYWLEPTLFSGWFLPDLYFDVLHGGNDYYSGNERFVKEFGEGLNRYLDATLIPTMEQKTKELFK